MPAALTKHFPSPQKMRDAIDEPQLLSPSAPSSPADMTSEELRTEHSTMPQELTGPAPRSVRLTRGGFVLTGLAVVLLLAVVFGCAKLCSLAVTEQQRKSILRSDGQVVTGVVTRMLAGGRGSSRSVQYSFLFNRTVYTGETKMPDFSGPHLEVGDDIPIRFLPENPSVNHPNAWEWSISAEWGWFLCLGILSLIVTMLFAQLHRERNLIQTGIVASAVVTSSTRTKNAYRTRYRFTAESGGTIKGGGNTNQSYSEGDRIWIIYGRDQPEKTIPYPLANFRLAD
ncbi:MAG: DUF3592 domain-containing protein [Acidobacteriaceae bacterium]